MKWTILLHIHLMITEYVDSLIPLCNSMRLGRALGVLSMVSFAGMDSNDESTFVGETFVIRSKVHEGW